MVKVFFSVVFLCCRLMHEKKSLLELKPLNLVSLVVKKCSVSQATILNRFREHEEELPNLRNLPELQLLSARGENSMKII